MSQTSTPRKMSAISSGTSGMPSRGRIPTRLPSASPTRKNPSERMDISFEEKPEENDTYVSPTSPGYSVVDEEPVVEPAPAGIDLFEGIDEDVVPSIGSLSVESVSDKALSEPGPNLLLLYSAARHYERLSPAFDGMSISEISKFCQDFASYAKYLEGGELYSHKALSLTHESLTLATLSATLIDQAPLGAYHYVVGKPFMSVLKMPGRFRLKEDGTVTTEVPNKFTLGVRNDSFTLANPDESAHPASLKQVVARFSTSRVGKFSLIRADSPATFAARTFLALYLVEAGVSHCVVSRYNFANSDFPSKYRFQNEDAFAAHSSTREVIAALKKLRKIPRDTFALVHRIYKANPGAPRVKLIEIGGADYKDTVSSRYLPFAIGVLTATKSSDRLIAATRRLLGGLTAYADLGKIAKNANARSDGLTTFLINPDLPDKEYSRARDLLFVEELRGYLVKMKKVNKATVVYSAKPDILKTANLLGFVVEGQTPVSKKIARTLRGGRLPESDMHVFIEPIADRNVGGDAVLHPHLSSLVKDLQNVVFFLPNFTVSKEFVAKGLPLGSDPMVSFHVKRNVNGSFLLASPSGDVTIAFTPHYLAKDNTNPVAQRKRVAKALRFVHKQHARTALQKVAAVIGQGQMPALPPKEAKLVQGLAAERLGSKASSSSDVLGSFEEEGSGYSFAQLLDDLEF